MKRSLRACKVCAPLKKQENKMSKGRAGAGGGRPSRNGGPGVLPPGKKFEFHIAADQFWGIFMGQKSYETSERKLFPFVNFPQFV